MSDKNTKKAILGTPVPMRDPSEDAAARAAAQAAQNNAGTTTEPATPVEPAAPLVTQPTAPVVQAERTTPAPGVVGAPDLNKEVTYLDLINKYMPHRSAGQVALDQQKENRAKLFSAIGDGISAFANLGGAMAGAQNAYDPAASMSAKTRAIWDKYNAERKAEDARYAATRINALQAQKGDERAREQMKLQLEQIKRDQAYKDKVFGYGKTKDEEDRKLKREAMAQDAKQFADSSSQKWAAINLDKAKFENLKDKENTTLKIGGKDVKVKSSTLLANVPALFEMLPSEIKSRIGKVSKDSYGQETRQNPTAEEMYNAVIGYANNDTNEGKTIQSAIEAMSGKGSDNMDMGLVSTKDNKDLGLK